MLETLTRSDVDTNAKKRSRPKDRERSALWLVSCRLLEAGRNRREGGRQLGTDRSHGSDDNDCDKSGDEPIFDSRCPRFVLDKAREHLHESLLISPTSAPAAIGRWPSYEGLDEGGLNF